MKRRPNNNSRTFQVEIRKMFSFSSFRALDRNRGKGTFACRRASPEACSLGPSFRKSVSIYPRSVPDLYVFLEKKRLEIGWYSA